MTLVQMMSSMQQIQSIIASMNQASPASAASAGSSDSFDQVLSTMAPSATGATGSVAPGSSGGTVTGADVVADAKKYLGVPYVLDGESTSGMDCSGLVQQTYKDLGITLPRTVHQQKLMGTAVPSLAQAQPGDLIVFKGGGHVAIYEGNDTVIHAPYPGRVVSNEKLWVGDSGIETIRRIVPSSTSATATASATPTVAPVATTPTSSTLQAAALAAVQATIQADSSLLLSTTGSSGSTDSSGTSDSMQSAITELENASGVDTTSGTSATSTTSASTSAAIQQFITTEEASLGEDQS